MVQNLNPANNNNTREKANTFHVINASLKKNILIKYPTLRINFEHQHKLHHTTTINIFT